MIGMKWRVWESKCILLKQIQELEDTALARRVSQEAYEKGWPGLQQEVEDICKDIGIPNINKFNIPRSQIKEAIFFSHYKDMKEEIGCSSKLDDIKN